MHKIRSFAQIYSTINLYGGVTVSTIKSGEKAVHNVQGTACMRPFRPIMLSISMLKIFYNTSEYAWDIFTPFKMEEKVFLILRFNILS